MFQSCQLYLLAATFLDPGETLTLFNMRSCDVLLNIAIKIPLEYFMVQYRGHVYSEPMMT